MSSFPLDRAAAVSVAADLVARRFPGALCGWLGGSVVAGRASETSDLDIVVLLAGPPAPFRDSLTLERDGVTIPVEMFVHSPTSLREFIKRDRARRQPSLARMVSEGVPLRAMSPTAEAAVEECRQEIAAGPDPLSRQEVDAARYAVTDLLEDLRGAGTRQERAVVAATLWEQSARLLLAVDRAWQGTGKGLLRALHARDAEHGDGLGSRMVEGLTTAGEPDEALAGAVLDVLDRAGGPLFAGYRVGGDVEPDDGQPAR